MIIASGKVRAFIGGFDDIPSVSGVINNTTPSGNLASVEAIRNFGGGSGSHKYVADTISISAGITTITHNLGEAWVQTQIFDNLKQEVSCAVKITSNNEIEIESNQAFTGSVVVIG